MPAARLRPHLLAVVAALTAALAGIGSTPATAATPTPAAPGVAEAPAGAASNPAYVSLLFGRAQYGSCRHLPGLLTITEVAARMQQLGVTGVGNVVVGKTENERVCDESRLYASWGDLATLRDRYGWTMISAGIKNTALGPMTSAEQRRESCGSLPALEAHGHRRAWGLFATPGNHLSLAAQKNIVSDCFAYSRTYGDRPNQRERMGAPWYQRTLSVNGGDCISGARSCSSSSQQTYTHPNELKAYLDAGPNEWRSLQVYLLVTGSKAGVWDCTGDPSRHWTRAAEMYCWDDYAAALRSIAPGVTVTDPATVAQAWGRGSP